MRHAVMAAATAMALAAGDGQAQEDDMRAVGAHGLALPASFSGVLPCADCPGVRHHLDLWPDQTFHLRREWLGGKAASVRDDIGRWHADPARQAIVLEGTAEGPIRWQVRDRQTVRLLDQAGEPIESELNYALTGDGSLSPTEVSLPMEGMFTHFADSARFTLCRTGRSYPVEMEAGYLAAERAYLDARVEPQAPVMMVLDGTLAVRPGMEGPERESLVIDALITVQPGRACGRPGADAALEGTYWLLTRLDGETVTPEPGAQEPHLALLGGEDRRLAATMGCNRMLGGYTLEGPELSFGPVAATMMACPEPLASLEQDFAATLERVRGWRIVGHTLILRGEGAAPLATFAAAYLP